MAIKSYLKNNALVMRTYDTMRDCVNRFKFTLFPKKSIERLYKKKIGRPIDLNSPKTYTEKLNWLKLFWHNPLLTRCIDKYLVRSYIEEQGLGDLLTKLYGVYDDIDKVDFASLPEKFALKMNNGSGCNVLCTDKSKLNLKEIRTNFKREMKRNYYYTYGEWGYKDIIPKIICESYIDTVDGKPPKDYKIFCFNGEPQYLFVASDRINHQTKFDFYTKDWEWLPVRNKYPNAGDVLEKLAYLDEMLRVARILSKPFPAVRVDLYYEGGKIYFGELTFYHFSAFTPFDPDSFDEKMGREFILPPKWKGKR